MPDSPGVCAAQGILNPIINYVDCHIEENLNSSQEKVNERITEFNTRLLRQRVAEDFQDEDENIIDNSGLTTEQKKACFSKYGGYSSHETGDKNWSNDSDKNPDSTKTPHSFYSDTEGDAKNLNGVPCDTRETKKDYENLPLPKHVTDDPSILGPNPRGISFLSSFPGSLFNAFGLCFKDDSELDLLRMCLFSTSVPLTTLSFSFFFFTILIGVLIDIPARIFSVLLTIFMFICQHLYTSVKELWADFTARKIRKRQLFGSPQNLRNWILDPFLTQSREEVRKHWLKLNRKVIKPDGIVGSNPKKKVIIDHLVGHHTQDKASEQLETDLIEDRPHLKITLPNGEDVLALIDTGATSSVIHPELLRRLNNTHPVPLIKKTYGVSGIIQGAASQGDSVALVNFTINQKTTLTRVPRLVLDNHWSKPD